MIWGYEADQTLVGEILGRARAGHSTVLVLRGDPGIGKTALLEEAALTATGMTVLSCAGVETEAEVPFAALHQLLRPALSHVDALPEVQGAALRAALGMSPTAGGDQLLVGVAVLSLLAELAEERAVLCLVDDAHWLDRASAQALRFVARRLQAEAIAVLFGARDEFDPAGLPEHRLDGLDADAAARLVNSCAPGLPEPVRARIVAESGGNPLALRELSRLPAPADTRPLPIPERIREAFAARLDALPAPARAALVIAAADDAADLGTVLRALELAGLDAVSLGTAEEAGLIQVTDGRIAFTHPLLRAAAYRHTTFDRRLAAHRALADALDGALGSADAAADRRAWHLAAASTGPDEQAAHALESAAERARGRKGFAATAAALQRAAELSVLDADRAARLVAAAQAANAAGRPDQTKTLLDRLPLGAEAGAAWAPRMFELRARLAFDEGAADAAHDYLVGGAAAVACSDRVAAALMLIDAARNAWQLSDPDRVAEATRRLRALGLRPEDGLDPATAAVAGAAELLAGRVAAGIESMRWLPSAGRPDAGPPNLRLNAAFVAALIGDFEASRDISAAVADKARAEGAVGWLPLAHVILAAAELYLGRFRDAVATAAEGLQLAADTGQPNRAGYLEGILAWIAAARGEADECLRLAQRCHRQYARNHIANGLAWAEWALALLDLGHGRAAQAADRLDAALAGPVRHQIQAVYFAPDQVEAAVRVGDRERAEAACERFAEWAQAAKRPWADAVLHRCRALLSPDWRTHFTAALSLHATDGRPWEAARTHLAYGERLRRERHKTEARAQLRAAAERFERLGAQPWARRARAELRAAGEQATTLSTGDTLAALSPQELQIVRLVAAGLTNREIGTQLFISPKTVSYHLYRAFPKLNVASRTQLARLDFT
jgi:DNA-binding CsgD family transcriptional regulator